MSPTALSHVAVRGWRMGTMLLAPAVVLAVAAVGLPAPNMKTAGAERQEAPAPVRRPLHDMVEGFAEGTVVAIEYLQTYYCPTTPTSDLDGPFGHGDAHPQSEDPSEYQLPPCFAGDTGTGSLLPDHLHAGALQGAKPFFALVPLFGGAGLTSDGPPTAVGMANSPVSDIDTHCSEPGPPVTKYKGQPNTCLMHPSTVRIAKDVFNNPNSPPDPVPLPQHSHLLSETSAAPAWWVIRPVAIHDRSIWPDHDGNCPAGPPRCVTSTAALRAAQETGQASIDVPSNLYFYMTVHPQER